MTEKKRAERLPLALALHRSAQEDYDHAEAALRLAATVLDMGRNGVEQMTNGFRDEKEIDGN